jgi:hypothetical protein
MQSKWGLTPHDFLATCKNGNKIVEFELRDYLVQKNGISLVESLTIFPRGFWR